MNGQMLSASWVIRDQWTIDITKLSGADFDSYGKAVVICAGGDGVISQAERAWIVGYFSAAGYPESTVQMLSTYDGSDKIEDVVKASVPVQQSIRTLVYDAIRACSADGDFNDGERAAVVRMASQVGLTEKDVAALEAAYHVERAAQRMRVEVCYPGGVPAAFRAG